MNSSCVDGKHAALCLQFDFRVPVSLGMGGKLEELEGAVRGSEDDAFKEHLVCLSFQSLIDQIVEIIVCLPYHLTLPSWSQSVGMPGAYL